MKKYIAVDGTIPEIYVVDKQKTKYVFRNLRYNAPETLTQKELARQLKVDIKTVQGWEQGKSIPSRIILNDICDRYGITLQDILLPNAPKKEIVPKERRRVKCTAKTVGEYLNNILRSSGKAKKEAAQVLGVAEYTINVWINDNSMLFENSNLVVMPRLAYFAGVSFNELMEGIYPDDLNPAKCLGLEEFIAPEGNAFRFPDVDEGFWKTRNFIEGIHRLKAQVEAYIYDSDELNLNELEYLLKIYLLNGTGYGTTLSSLKNNYGSYKEMKRHYLKPAYSFLFDNLGKMSLVSNNEIFKALDPEEIKSFIEHLKTSKSLNEIMVSTVVKLLYLDFMNEIKDKKTMKGYLHEKYHGISLRSDFYNILLINFPAC